MGQNPKSNLRFKLPKLKFTCYCISNFRSALKFLIKNKLLETMMPRIVQIMAWSWPCGYGFHDMTGETFCELVPPQYHSKVEEADALGEAQYYAMHPSLKH